MAVTGINQIHISVTDLDRAVIFYRDLLGIDLLFEVPEQSMAFFDLNGIRLYVGEAEDAELVSAPLLYFSVDDIQSEFDRLAESDIEFVEGIHLVHESEGIQLWMAFFKTPDGHVNAIVESRSTA